MDIDRIIYLAKDNADLICHCTCSFAPIAFPGQMDCPWCGCGWLFTCIYCRKALTFARGVWLEDLWENLAQLDLVNSGIKEPSPYRINEHAEALQEMLAEVKIGQKYVYLDGAIIPADATGVHLNGRHARHDFDFVPQVQALRDFDFIPHVETLKSRFILCDILGNKHYWTTNAINRE